MPANRRLCSGRWRRSVADTSRYIFPARPVAHRHIRVRATPENRRDGRLPAHSRRRRLRAISGSRSRKYLAKNGMRVTKATGGQEMRRGAEDERHRPRRARHHDARRGRPVALPPSARDHRHPGDPADGARRGRPTASSGSRSAPTTMSPSRSIRANCWRASARCCAARQACRSRRRPDADALRFDGWTLDVPPARADRAGRRRGGAVARPSFACSPSSSSARTWCCRATSCST